MSAALLTVLVLLSAVPTVAELPAQDLALPRQVTEGSWLNLRLQVLGLSLSYPAYRVSVALTDSDRVGFEFWMSTGMAKHLSEEGRDETERILAYHAKGIQNRVADLLREEFSALWPSYNSRLDFGGDFMTAGTDLDAPPQRWARWREEALEWSWRP